MGWFSSDPIKKLRDQYMKKMEHARDIQRTGDIVKYSELVAEAEKIGEEIDRLESEK